MKIPSKIRLTHKRTYEVLWVDSFDDPTIVGECRSNPPQIVIKRNHGDEVFTFIHEFFHSLSNEYELNLTERQVQGIENALKRVIKLNKITLQSPKD